MFVCENQTQLIRRAAIFNRRNRKRGMLDFRSNSPFSEWVHHRIQLLSPVTKIMCQRPAAFESAQLLSKMSAAVEHALQNTCEEDTERTDDMKSRTRVQRRTHTPRGLRRPTIRTVVR